MKKINKYIATLASIAWISLLLLGTLQDPKIWPLTVTLLLIPVYAVILEKQTDLTFGEGDPFELVGIAGLLAMLTAAIIWVCIQILSYVM